MKYHATSQQRAAFTLVEVLVSMTVLILLVSLVSSITNNATRTISGGGRRIESDNEARSVFNRMAIDFSRMIRRPDLNYSAFQKLPGNDAFAFYAEANGYPPQNATTGQLSPYSIVGYQVAGDNAFFPGSVLNRTAEAQKWLPAITSGTITLPTSATSVSTAGNLVFRMEYTLLQKDGTISPTASIKDAAAIVVGIGVLDGQARAMASGGDLAWKDSSLTAPLVFADVTNDQLPLNVWQSKLNSTGGIEQVVSDGGIPANAARAIRVYQRYFYLP